MPVIIPDDHPSRYPPKSEPFDWDKWIIPGKRIEFRKNTDFPNSSMTTFRQSLRNALGRRGLAGKYRTFQIDDDTFELTWKER